MDTATPPKRGLTAFVERLLDHTWRWGAVLVISGWLLGVSLYPLVHWDTAEYMIKNDLPAEDRSDVLRYGLYGIVLTTALYVGMYLKWRRTERGLRMTEAFTRFTKKWFVALVAPLLAGLFAGNMESNARMLAMFFVMIITAFVMVVVHRRSDPETRSEGEGTDDAVKDADEPDVDPVAALPKWYRDTYFRWALFACFMYGTLMTYLSLMDHWSIATHAFDLGIYDNILWNTTNGDFLGCSMCKGGNHSYAHFDPLLYLFTPIYRVFPRAETLLVIQAWWIASTGIPMYLIARRALPEARAYCVGIVVVFFLHPATHGVNLFDFHSLALCMPLVLWCVYCIDANNRIGFVIALSMLLLNREDMPIFATFIGIYAIVKLRPIWGVLTIVVCVTYLVVVKMYFMPDPGLLMQPDSASSYIYYYEDMIPRADEGMKGLVLNFFSNPVFVLKMIFLDAAKNQYVFGLFVPLLMLPLFGRSKRILMLYGLVFIGVASRRHVFSYHFQYSAVILPAIFAALPEGTKRVTQWAKARRLVPSEAHLRRTLMWGMVTATFLFGARFGAFIPNRSFKGGWNRLNRWMDAEARERHAHVRELVEQIPQDAVVSATSALVPHVSNRAEVHKFPAVNYADYLLLYVSKFEEDKKRNKKYGGKIRRIRRDYVTVGEFDGIELFRRIAPKKGEKPSEEWLELKKQRDEERRAERERKRGAKQKGGKKDAADRKRPTPKSRPAVRPKPDADAPEAGITDPNDD